MFWIDDYMVKYIIREIIEYEGFRQWTVFAQSIEMAFHLIKRDVRYTGEKLAIQSTKSAKGRKEPGIHKYTQSFYK